MHSGELDLREHAGAFALALPGDAAFSHLTAARLHRSPHLHDLARWWFWHWGLPEPELNSPVLDEGGGWLATADFVWKKRRVVGEYDGDVHRTDRATWQRDRERRAAVEDAHWTYVEMSAGSFAAPGPREALRRWLTRLLLV